jgi:uncharacterized protein (UPF0332 family)
MTEDQAGWLKMAKERLSAGRHTLSGEDNFARWAVADAYYVMFYCATALLLGKGQAFRSHGQLISSYGREFAATDVLPRHLHRYLIDSSELRTKGDYDLYPDIERGEAEEHLQHAEEFIALAEAYLQQQP